MPESFNEEAEAIKLAFANSMEKWNNVYFYSYNQDGSVTKNKIIEIVETTKGNQNLTIYPREGRNGVAGADWGDDYTPIQSEPVAHFHYSNWKIYVNIEWFYQNTNTSLTTANVNRARTGAHEIGHMLGLYDVGNYCRSSNPNSLHHHELLMGSAIESIGS